MKRCEKCNKVVLLGKLVDGLCDECNQKTANKTLEIKELLKDDKPDIDIDAKELIEDEDNFKCDMDCANCSRNHNGFINKEEAKQQANDEFEGKKPASSIMPLSVVLDKEEEFDIDLFSVIASGLTSLDGQYKGYDFSLTILPQQMAMLTGDFNNEEEITKVSEIISMKIDPVFKKHYKFYDINKKIVSFMWGYNSFDICKKTIEGNPLTGEVFLLEE